MHYQTRKFNAFATWDQDQWLQTGCQKLPAARIASQTVWSLEYHVMARYEDEGGEGDLVWNSLHMAGNGPRHRTDILRSLGSPPPFPLGFIRAVRGSLDSTISTVARWLIFKPQNLKPAR